MAELLARLAVAAALWVRILIPAPQTHENMAQSCGKLITNAEM